MWKQAFWIPYPFGHFMGSLIKQSRCAHGRTASTKKRWAQNIPMWQQLFCIYGRREHFVEPLIKQSRCTRGGSATKKIRLAICINHANKYLKEYASECKGEVFCASFSSLINIIVDVVIVIFTSVRSPF